jgi:hypothetical protein
MHIDVSEGKQNYFLTCMLIMGIHIGEILKLI